MVINFTEQKATKRLNFNNRVVKPTDEEPVLIQTPKGENLNNRGCQPTDNEQVGTHFPEGGEYEQTRVQTRENDATDEPEPERVQQHREPKNAKRTNRTIFSAIPTTSGTLLFR